MTIRNLLLAGSVIATGAFVSQGIAQPVRPTATDWPTYNHDAAGTKFSPLKDITPANVNNLQVAWTYHMQPPTTGTGPAARMRGSQATPVVIKGVMYVTTPYGRVVALDAQTGQQKWAYATAARDTPAMRGVEYWPGDATHGPRVIFGTRQGKLIALNAADGSPAKGWGVDGVIDMKTPEIVNGLPDSSYSLSSTPLLVGDVVVTGSLLQEAPAKGSAGDVRAWDVRTGKLRWTFHTVPRKGEFGYETWENESGAQRSGVNVWTFMTADLARGIVYLPVAAPAFDRYGGDRHGLNLFSNSLVALNAKTGKRLWHFQAVHHDIWDHDLPTQPTLIEVRHGATTIPGIVAMSKAGILFMLDRVTGKPIYEVKETPVPPSDVPNEAAWPTQPIPVKPAPLTRQSFDPAKDIADVTPELKAFCQNLLTTRNIGGSAMYEPIHWNKLTARFPGSGGGPNWGGGAYDPQNGLYLINLSELGSVESIIQSKDGQMVNGGGNWFSNPQGKLMCQTPPWGTLTAVNVNTGDIAWQTPLGVTDSLPEGKQTTGRPNVGGPIITGSGLVFIGAADDARFRAFDVKTGKEIWTTKLKAAAHNTPVTYRGTDGRQYVSATASGGSYLGSAPNDDSIIAWALPK